MAEIKARYVFCAAPVAWTIDQSSLGRGLTSLSHFDRRSDAPVHSSLGRRLHRTGILQRLRGGANTRASRRICVKGQTNVVDQLLMSRGKADIRNDGRLVRRFDDRRPLSKVE